MRFGYFLNHNNRHLSEPFHQVIEAGRDIARYCDTHGWHSIWCTEHHFGHEGLEVCPNPTLMSVDLAAHTQNLRIGQAANIITFHHPLRLAEDIAVLDHMCGGRTEVGIGRGIYPRETINLNPAADVRNQAVNQEVFEETLEILRRAWSQDFFSFKGKHYEFPYPGITFDHAMSCRRSENTDPKTGEITKLALVPRPLQQPTPPLWQVIDSPKSIQFAARNDLQGLFWIPPTDSMRSRFELYRDTRSEATGEEVPLGKGLGVLRDMFVTETMEQAEKLAGGGMLEYLRWVCHYRGLGNHLYPGEELPKTDGKLDLLSYDWIHPRNMLFVTPDYVAEKIYEMKEKLNLETLLVWSSFPGIPHEAVMDSITLFTEKVMPHFQDSGATNPSVATTGKESANL